MHLRRALLLFAIVLVVSALAASISPPRREQEGSEPPPELTRDPEPPRKRPAGVKLLRFSTSGKPKRREVDVGTPARVSVAADEPGQVELAGLGRTATAVPGTPATFDLLPTAKGRHAVLFEAAAKDEPERVGTLVVEQGSLLR